MLASATGPEELVAVVGNGEAVVPCDPFLQAFNLRILKLNNLATVDADEVVVMRTFDHAFVVFLSPSKVMFLDNLFLNK